MTVRKKLLFSFIALMLTFGALEVTARIAAWAYHPFGRFGADMVADPVMHHTYIPSRTVEGLPYVLHINGQSWPEDHDIERRKPPGVFRIFMVGDSNTQGYVAPSLKWVTIVGRELNERASREGNEAITYEVINAGRRSYSPLLYYLHIKLQILSYSPDLIVINVDMTDCRDDAAYRLTMRTNAVGEIVGVTPSTGALDEHGLIMTPSAIRRPTSWERSSKWLIEHSACLAYLHLAIFNIAEQSSWLHNFRETVASAGAAETNGLPKVLYADWLQKTWGKDVEDNVAFSMGMLGKSIDLLKSNGVGCIVVGVPHYPQFTGQYSIRPYDALAETARQHGVPFLNLYEAFRPQIATSEQSDFYVRHDIVHFNERGNRLWADAFLDFWEKNKTNFIAAVAK